MEEPIRKPRSDRKYKGKPAGAHGARNTPAYAHRVAKTLLEVLQDTGRINYTEMRHRLYPNAARITNQQEGFKMITPEVREEFYRLIRVDESAVEKLSSKDVIRSILNDLHKIDIMMESPHVEADEISKLATTKTAKQKLLGQYLGIWREDKKVPEDAEDPDAVFNRFNNRLGLLN